MSLTPVRFYHLPLGPTLPTINPALITTLRFVYDRLGKTDIKWVLTGSTAFAAQGLPFSPADIDIQTNESGAYAFGKLMSDFEVTPVHPRRDSPIIRSHFGSFNVHGVIVEVMGDMQKRVPDADWVPAPSLDEIIEHIDYRGMRLPVFPLAYEAESYRMMQRFEKAKLLAAYAGSSTPKS